jgi:myo-inositol-1(or 4)-monophosphatase
VIAQEAGGFVTGSKDSPHDGVVTEAILTGRRYLVIRGVAGTSVRVDSHKELTEIRRTNLFFISFPLCVLLIHPFT